MKSSKIPFDSLKKNTCQICASPYDHTLHKPYSINACLHPLCHECLSNLNTGDECPFCNQIIDLVQTGVNPSTIINEAPIISQPTLANQTSIDNIIKRKKKKQTKKKVNKRTEPSQDIIIDENIIRNENCSQEIGKDGEHRKFKLFTNDLDPQRVKIYTIALAIQFVFTFCNLYFSINNSQTQCMDQPHGSLILRDWLLGIGITQTVLIFIMLINVFLYKVDCICLDTMELIEKVFVLFSLVKIVLWAGIQLNMISEGLISYCNGGLFAYLLTITIIHLIIGVIILILTVVFYKR